MTSVGDPKDPCFVHQFEAGARDGFYVRKWTNNVVSGDTGREPSTPPVFYATSDVWNRRSPLPGPFPSDQPSNEEAGNGAGAIGDNWAFARVRRNAAGIGSTTVTAHFLVSRLGTGNNYFEAGSLDPDVKFPAPAPTLTFSATELGPLTTPGYPWHLSAAISTRLCLAVEISTPAHPLVAPSLLGRAYGWQMPDLAVIDDNTRAQRNLGLATTTARGAELSDELFAWVHNAATFRRDVTIRMQASEATLRRLAGAKVQVAGAQVQPFVSGGSIMLRDLAPGENRWVRISFTPPHAKVGEVLALLFEEIVAGNVINGFGIGTRIGTDAQVARAVLERHRSVFARLAACGGPDGAERQAELATQALRSSRTLDLKRLGVFVRTHSDVIVALVDAHVHAQGQGDAFGIVEAARTLPELANKWDDLAVAHTRLLERLDTFLTAVELEHGDPADILQTLHWQIELYLRLPRLCKLECADEMVRRARGFIAACVERRFGVRAYPVLIKSLLRFFDQTAQEFGDETLAALVEAMRRRPADLAWLQKAHRDFLLAIDDRGRTTDSLTVPWPSCSGADKALTG